MAEGERVYILEAQGSRETDLPGRTLLVEERNPWEISAEVEAKGPVERGKFVQCRIIERGQDRGFGGLAVLEHLEAPLLLLTGGQAAAESAPAHRESLVGLRLSDLDAFLQNFAVTDHHVEELDAVAVRFFVRQRVEQVLAVEVKQAALDESAALIAVAEDISVLARAA